VGPKSEICKEAVFFPSTTNSRTNLTNQDGGNATREIKNSGSSSKRTILQSIYSFYYLAATCFGIAAIFRATKQEGSK
jgi:hypothetical protein